MRVGNRKNRLFFKRDRYCPLKRGKEYLVNNKKKPAQSIVEYSLVFAAVIAAVVMMQLYFRYSVDAKLKRTAVGLNSVFEEINK